MVEGDGSGYVEIRSAEIGRKRTFDPVWKERLVLACLRSGVSVSKLALENKVNANQLRKWIHKYRLSQQGHHNGVGGNRKDIVSGSAFVPVIEAKALDSGARNPSLVVPAAQSAAEPKTVDKKPSGSSMQLNASLPNGVRLTLDLSDSSALVLMIGALGHVPSVG